MTAFDPVAALALPNGARVDRRVPKTLLIENSAPTATDKRRIREEVAEIRWLAALKPTTIGVVEYRDAVREYLEIAVLELTLRSGAHTDRLTELVHRAVPYPVLLIAWQGDAPELSLAHKRASQSEAGKTVIDGEIVTTRPIEDCASERSMAFGEALALNRQPRATLHALYQGWIDVARALNAARIIGAFSLPASAVSAASRADALREYQCLEAKIANLRVTASKEKQIANRAEINMALKRLRTRRAAARARL